MELSTILWICGIAVAFIAGTSFAKSKSKKEISSLKSRLSVSNTEIDNLKSQLNKTINPTPNNQVSAKEAFLSNIEKFVPLFSNLEKGRIDWNDWSDVVVDINNNNLIHLWKSVLNKLDAWIRVMASWGISYDSCIEFVYVIGREELYDNEDGTIMQEGHKYSVLSPCWIITKSTGNKSVIKKGVVRLKK